MATAITVQKCNTPGEMLAAGASPLVAAAGKVFAAAATMEFSNDGKTILLVDNQQAAATTAIGFTFPNKSFAGAAYAPSGAGDTVAAATLAIFGPFPTSLNDANDKIQVTVGTLTTVFVAAVSIG